MTVRASVIPFRAGGSAAPQKFIIAVYRQPRYISNMAKGAPFREKSGVGAFLWWAILITLIGGAASYYMHISAGVDPASQGPVRVVIAITVLLVGVCLVIATSRWWIHR